MGFCAYMGAQNSIHFIVKWTGWQRTTRAVLLVAYLELLYLLPALQGRTVKLDH